MRSWHVDSLYSQGINRALLNCFGTRPSVPSYTGQNYVLSSSLSGRLCADRNARCETMDCPLWAGETRRGAARPLLLLSRNSRSWRIAREASPEPTRSRAALRHGVGSGYMLFNDSTNRFLRLKKDQSATRETSVHAQECAKHQCTNTGEHTRWYVTECITIGVLSMWNTITSIQ